MSAIIVMNVFSGNPPTPRLTSPVEFSSVEIAMMRRVLRFSNMAGEPAAREIAAKLLLVHSAAVDAGAHAEQRPQLSHGTFSQRGHAQVRALLLSFAMGLALVGLLMLHGCGGGDDYQTSVNACAAQAAAVAAQAHNGPTVPTAPLAGCTQ